LVPSQTESPIRSSCPLPTVSVPLKGGHGPALPLAELPLAESLLDEPLAGGLPLDKLSLDALLDWLPLEDDERLPDEDGLPEDERSLEDDGPLEVEGSLEDEGLLLKSE
jgi:hypothetical protein